MFGFYKIVIFLNHACFAKVVESNFLTHQLNVGNFVLDFFSRIWTILSNSKIILKLAYVFFLTLPRNDINYYHFYSNLLYKQIFTLLCFTLSIFIPIILFAPFFSYCHPFFSTVLSPIFMLWHVYVQICLIKIVSKRIIGELHTKIQRLHLPQQSLSTKYDFFENSENS